VQVRASPKGSEVLQAARTRRVAALAAALDALPERDLRTLERSADLLERVVAG